jgi:hypothetical protein
MKTARERAEEWLYENGFQKDEEWTLKLEDLLKEQDKITRHACADAVLGVYATYQSQKCMVADVSEYHAACINVESV